MVSWPEFLEIHDDWRLDINGYIDIFDTRINKHVHSKWKGWDQMRKFKKIEHGVGILNQRGSIW